MLMYMTLTFCLIQNPLKLFQGINPIPLHEFPHAWVLAGKNYCSPPPGSLPGLVGSARGHLSLSAPAPALFPPLAQTVVFPSALWRSPLGYEFTEGPAISLVFGKNE